MFYHNFKYTLKILFRNKMLIFWTLLFPIVLGTLFKFAFMDIEKNETFKEFDIAVVNNQEFENDIFLKESFKNLRNENNKMFNIIYTSSNDAKKMLKNKEITG